MKQFRNKALRMFSVLLCMSLLTVFVQTAVLAEEADQDALSQVLVAGQGLTDTLIGLTEDQIEAYEDSTDAFTVEAVNAWVSSREELGALTDAENAEPTAVQNGNEYTVTVPRSFENANANFVYVFDRRLNPETLTVDVQLPMGVTLARAALNTLIGICTVFLVLIFLSFIISLLKYVPGLVGQGKKAKEEPARAAAPAPAPVSAPAAAEEYVTDDQELIAVIAAAIAAAEGTTPEGFVVRSIRKSNRRKR
ncbi:MAG: OadG family protein [Blautia sp.]|nr:OadG family protein [Blautia sp.]